MVWRVGAHTPYPLSLLSPWEEPLIIEVQLKPSPTWPLLPYPRVSNAKHTPWKPLNTIHQDSNEASKKKTQNETLPNPPNIQAKNNNTIQGAKTSMNKTWRSKCKSKVSYLHPRVMVTMEVWEELPFSSFNLFTIFQAFSKSRDWVTTPKLLQKSTK